MTPEQARDAINSTNKALLNLVASASSASTLIESFHRAAVAACPDQVEALELGFKPSFSRSRRLHKKLVKKALARGAALIV